MSSVARKRLATCIYCLNPPNGKEHWLNRGFGTFVGNSYLTGRICTSCNRFFGETIDRELLRTGHTGMTRQVLGIKGRSKHVPKNVFDYKASNREAPIQVFKQREGKWSETFEQAIARNADGTLLALQARSLTVASDGQEYVVPFPIGWSEHELRGALQERGLLGAKVISAHVRPPETIEQFESRATDTLRAVFGQFEIDVHVSQQGQNAPQIEPAVVRFNLNSQFFRGIAKVGFHYFLWATPQVGGDEAEFSELRQYIRDGVGEPHHFVNVVPSTVDRLPPETAGPGQDCHVFATFFDQRFMLVQLHFFSQSVGPNFPSFVLKLGSRPSELSQDWRRVHVAAYNGGIHGHDGTLRELELDRDS